jgi:pyruvoyl-dependent arginine decarboxylase (PvlArgDC)|tara:strand:+ start:385 stop:564 length:180 start_codon:yes stop_codon:yes gene_type:complete
VVAEELVEQVLKVELEEQVEVALVEHEILMEYQEQLIQVVAEAVLVHQIKVQEQVALEL